MAWRRWLRWLAAAVLLFLALFAWNGLVLAHRTVPVLTEIPGTATPATTHRVRVLAWNLAKCFVHRDGLSFASTQDVEARLRQIADLIRREDPDLVFLSEVVTVCTPCDVDQPAFLARATGLRHQAFGENYCFGLPFLRIVGGNAILSKRPLKLVANPDLAGRRPFWITRNNRRVLFCEADLGGQPVLLGAIHTDSFDLANNLRQTRQILAFDRDAPMLLAGDFNAEPDSASLTAVIDSGRFTGALHGRATFPASSPRVRIDYVFAPAAWRLVDSRVLDDLSSDHLPVVATFELPK